MGLRTGATTEEIDVLVVGGGAARLAAAIEAARAGAWPLIVEAANKLGGAAAVSGGGALGVGTELQRDAGISDTVELAIDDWMRWGGSKADRAWVERYVRTVTTR